jgi:hypothetical protein
MDIREIFIYPTKDKEWPVKMIIGIALSILPIVNFFCSGYAYRIFKAGLNRQPIEMHEWDDWGDIFIQGLIIFVLRLIYFLIPLALMGTGAGILIVGFILKDKTGYFPQATILPIALLIGIGLILAIVAAIIFPMALALYAKNNEEFGAAFRVWEIVPKIFQALDDYLIAIVLMVCVFFAFFILCVIPYLGMLFALILSFYLKYLFYYALFGSACAGAFEADTPSGAPATGT